MHRACWSACLLVLSFPIGCHYPPEQLPLQPAPENGAGLAYAELVHRARLQAGSATEAFHLNKWSALEDAARNLEQTARMLVMTTDVPARQKDRLAAHVAELSKDAAELRKAAKAEDVPRSNGALQRIHLKIREMRPEG
jgi:hypothetical protein